MQKGDSRSVLRPGRLFCWLSGWTPSYRPEGWYGPTALQVAHIASGGGKAIRVDDRRAVISLSPLCHMLHISDSEAVGSMAIGARVYPTIDERHTLFLKRLLDPDFYDPEYLQSIWIGRLPDPEPPPEQWCRELFDNQGILITHDLP